MMNENRMLNEAMVRAAEVLAESLAAIGVLPDHAHEVAASPLTHMRVFVNRDRPGIVDPRAVVGRLHELGYERTVQMRAAAEACQARQGAAYARYLGWHLA